MMEFGPKATPVLSDTVPELAAISATAEPAALMSTMGISVVADGTSWVSMRSTTHDKLLRVTLAASFEMP
ncbi:hypothetical protein D3C86_1448100 [compost metagenome]